MRCKTVGAFLPFFIARSFGKHAAGPLWESVKQKVRHGQVQAPKALRHPISHALNIEMYRELSTLLFAANWSTGRRAYWAVNNDNGCLLQCFLSDSLWPHSQNPKILVTVLAEQRCLNPFSLRRGLVADIRYDHRDGSDTVLHSIHTMIVCQRAALVEERSDQGFGVPHRFPQIN
jgi:hypothetical protein